MTKTLKFGRARNIFLNLIKPLFRFISYVSRGTERRKLSALAN